ncbi:MAG: hypothetical protein Kow0090_01200 [Myxococcota bacterium]
MRTLYLRRIERTCLDELDAYAIIVSLEDTRRPPQGLLGWLDWRMNGFISRFILSGDFSGGKGARALMNTYGRVNVPRVFLFGWSDEYFMREKQLTEAVEYQITTALKAGCEEIAIEIPYPKISLEFMASWEKAVIAALMKLEIGSDIHLFVEPHFVEPLKNTFSAARLPVSVVE